jgi:hypothetical protein
MVYAHEHILLRFNGHFGTSTGISDRWSVGVRLGQASLPVPYDAAKLQTLANSAHAAAKLFHSTTAAVTGTSCYYDQTAAACIGPSGKYVPPGAVTILSPLEATAGVGSPNMPWNAAIVMSLRTANARGRGSNGRVYWPALAASVAIATGRLGTGPVASRVNLFKQFLDSLNVAANAYLAGTRVIVASNVGTGLNAVVTAVRSDERLDSIERRENDQPANYSSAALA